MRCDGCDHPVTVHDHSGCVSCQARYGDAFWCSRTDADFASPESARDDLS